MANDLPEQRAPATWLEALDRGRQDIASGRTSDFEPFLHALEIEDAEELASESHHLKADEALAASLRQA